MKFATCLIPQRLSEPRGARSDVEGVCCDVERLSNLDPACTLAAAAAHAFNDELTVILSSVSTLIRELEPEHPARLQALDLQSAAQRCARKTSGLLRFSLRRGARATRTSLECLIQEP